MKTKEITPEMRSIVLAEYQKGTGTCEIAEKLNVKRWVPWRILSQAGVELRKKSVYKKKYNQQFFDEYSPESAYWAGFILADGNVTRNSSLLQIGLSKVDESHLLKFCQAIGLESELIPDGDCVRMSVSGKHMCQSLADNFGVYPRKSNVCVFPEQIPNHLWSHFIRGVFDGDGCVTFGKYTNKQSEQKRTLVINFTGSIELLDFLKNHFYNSIGVVVGRGSFSGIPPTHIVGRHKKTGEFSYSGRNAVIILDWLYDNSEEKTRLERKYEKFQNLKANYD
jgi:hypothetical protein